jgi:isopenicillin N synthase-like dioxygenase
MTTELPVIDVSRAPAAVAREIDSACRDLGFFYAVGHGIPAQLTRDLFAAAWRFFRLPVDGKRAIAMSRGGRAWRGWFPLGGELTSGVPDLKEGVYFGEELLSDDPRVRANLPLHGANLFPNEVPELRTRVLAYIAEATRAAHAIMKPLAVGLGLDDDYFGRHYTARPTVLFRIFHYPATDRSHPGWGVGEHTDYGLLTLLAQDDVGGLEVKTERGWIAAPPIDGALVVNIGDMLDRLTGGLYRSTPHRVSNQSGRGRLSMPFFFDPAFDARIVPLPERTVAALDPRERWDNANPHDFDGTYGDYLLAKVSRVFPDLHRRSI